MGLIIVPALYAWYNIAASWDPYGNTKSLKVAVANVDSGYKSDLIPVIIQHAESKDVLMLGFTNREAVERTLQTKTAWFWSRSRQKLWNKGETSGHFLHVRRVITDCDTDTLLYLCTPDGPTCHTGAQSCFFNVLMEEEE